MAGGRGAQAGANAHWQVAADLVLRTADANYGGQLVKAVSYRDAEEDHVELSPDQLASAATQLDRHRPTATFADKNDLSHSVDQLRADRLWGDGNAFLASLSQGMLGLGRQATALDMGMLAMSRVCAGVATASSRTDGNGQARIEALLKKFDAPLNPNVPSVAPAFDVRPA